MLAYDSQAHLKNEAYAWSWAAVAFLDNHPRYRERFHEMWRLTGDPNFNKQLAKRFAPDGAELVEEFQVFASDLAYGYDFNRTAIDFSTGKPMAGRRAKVTVAADRGWQNSGVKLDAGKTYRLTASGRSSGEACTRCMASREACRFVTFTASRSASCSVPSARMVPQPAIARWLRR